MEHIRNFVIIAHIDHGKSTLADRFLDVTGAVDKRVMTEQFLDSMELERERGITIKMQPVRMQYGEYALNLIDTPGHVDFSYEVSRSMAAVEGAVLLVDATKGVQAQTLANLKLAREQNLVIIPALNKVDLASARTELASRQVGDLLGTAPDDILRVSAKTGQGVKELLDAVVSRVPPPEPGGGQTKALLFDSRYDAFLGVVAYVRLKGGRVRTGDELRLSQTGGKFSVKEAGRFLPKETPVPEISDGEIGYVATGIKDEGVVQIGDTLVGDPSTPPLSGYAPPKPVVFVSFYPQDTDDFALLKDALAKLRLSDPSFVSEPEGHEALGRGFRCGFLGALHSEIISERVQREFGVPLVISRPSVEFLLTDTKGETFSVKTAADWPEEQRVERVQEPWVRLEVLCPQEQFSSALQVLERLEGEQKEAEYLESTVRLAYEVPLREVIVDLYDRLKSATQGMASMDYEAAGMREADLVKLEVLLAGEKEEAFSKVVPRQKAYQEGKKLVEKLKEVLPPQQFAVPLQAVVGGKVLARETMKARRRDVTAPLYGGDVTRKRKLLERQKKGKKALAAKGRVTVPPQAFLEVFRG